MTAKEAMIGIQKLATENLKEEKILNFIEEAEKFFKENKFSAFKLTRRDLVVIFIHEYVNQKELLRKYELSNKIGNIEKFFQHKLTELIIGQVKDVPKDYVEMRVSIPNNYVLHKINE